MPEEKQLSPEEMVVRSFQIVKEFVVNKLPEFSTIQLEFCPDADIDNELSAIEKAEEEMVARVFAHVLHYPDKVCVTAKMAGLTEAQRQGIFIHEFGHLYADRYSILPPQYAPEITNPEERLLDPLEDADADFVVETVFNVKMGYDESEIEFIALPIGSQLPDPPVSQEEVDKMLAEEDPIFEEDGQDGEDEDEGNEIGEEGAIEEEQGAIEYESPLESNSSEKGQPEVKEDNESKEITPETPDGT